MQNVANLEFLGESFEGFERKAEVPAVCLSNFDEGDPFVSHNYSAEITTDQVLNQPILESDHDETPVAHVPQHKAGNQTSLHGCVLCRFNDDTVKCVLLIDNKQHETMLPLQLFVSAGIEIEEGVAFTAELKIVDGFKSLVVSPCMPQQNQKSKREIYDLLARL